MTSPDGASYGASDRTDSPPSPAHGLSKPTAVQGLLGVRLAANQADIEAVRGFRAKCFGVNEGADGDAFDLSAQHVLIERRDLGTLVGYFRIQLVDPHQVRQSYSGQYYDLSRLAGFHGRMLEVGRFCVDAPNASQDVVRLAWGSLAQVVEACGIEMLFGCSSFQGTSVAPHQAAFHLLSARHAAPPEWRPGIGAAEIIRFDRLPCSSVDLRAGWSALPALLRSYLAMGGWVSDHAVVDYTMKTLHVFTGLEVAKVPFKRREQLLGIVPDNPLPVKAVDALIPSA